MNPLQPIYTKDTKCQDCYKCLRYCPVKAIVIKDGKASIDEKKCIYCGTCLKNCPVEAKTVREDINTFHKLLEEGHEIAVTIAPSYISDFPNVSVSNLIKAIKKIGVHHVYETAYGARILSAKISEFINKPENKDQKLFISTACTSITEIIKKHFPDKLKFCTPFFSPMLTLCKEIKNQLDNDVRIVFIGPCAAKKIEADQNKELCDLVLTFKDLKDLFTYYNISPDEAKDNEPEQTPFEHDGTHGVFYPVDGGMIKSIQACQPCRKIDYYSLSGIDEIYDLLNNLDALDFANPVFMELLSCKGGCINGPVTQNSNNLLLKHLLIENYAKKKLKPETQKFNLDVHKHYMAETETETKYTEKQIRQALIKVGKKSSNDELNCGGCGYTSCKNFARALLADKAEISMCVSYMRQLANNKANKLMLTIPSGVIIVDNNLKIIESNKKFAVILGGEILEMYESVGCLTGANLKKIVSFSDYFMMVLENDLMIEDKIVEYNDKFLSLSIFPIEEHNLVGAIIQDITTPAVQKEQVMQKVEELSKKHLRTVQQIASLLGENAAETEILVNSISKSFSADKKR